MGTDNAKERAEALIGHVVADRYRIDRIVAMGGMGAVFAGEHIHLHKRVAIKLLHPETEGLPELVARFERESIVGAHATHRNVAIATDFGKDADGSYYLVNELVPGINLKALIKRGPIPLDRVVDIARQLAEGLHAIHDLDIVHRDLNPRNVMVSEEPPDRVKLIDFGFAKVPVERFAGSARDRLSQEPKAGGADSLRLTAAGTVFGTIGFMAPEAAMGMGAVDKPADLYAFGVILYEMLAGVHPYAEKDQKKLFRCHALDPPPPFEERAPDRDVPEAFEAIVMKLLEKDPAERYQSASEVLAALDDALRARVATPAALVSDDSSPWTQRGPAKKGGARWGLWALVLVVIAGGAAMAVPSLRQQLLGSPPAPAPPPAVAPPPKLDRKPDSGPDTGPEPTASATASAAPIPAPRPTVVAGLDADAWTAKLKQAVAGKAAAECAKAIEALATLAPERIGSTELVPTVALGVVAVSLTPDIDGLFALLSSKEVGASGPDVFYRLVVFHGGSKAARRAGELLADPTVLDRASPAMRIAYELHKTSCHKRKSLLTRAAEEGDKRTLLILSNMTPRDCSSCCMHAPELGPALRKLNARLK